MRKQVMAIALALPLGACAAECQWARPIATDDGFELLQLTGDKAQSLRAQMIAHNRNYERFCR